VLCDAPRRHAVPVGMPPDRDRKIILPPQTTALSFTSMRHDDDVSRLGRHRCHFVWSGPQLPYHGRLAVESALVAMPDVDVHLLNGDTSGDHLDALATHPRLHLRDRTFDEVLEVLACGTPLVVPASGALPEIVTPTCGVVASRTAGEFADAVQTLLGRDRAELRHLARARRGVLLGSRRHLVPRSPRIAARDHPPDSRNQPGAHSLTPGRRLPRVSESLGFRVKMG
jgi:hypothetical protein